MDPIERRLREFCELTHMVDVEMYWLFPNMFEYNKPTTVKIRKNWNVKTTEEWKNIFIKELTWILDNYKEIQNFLPKVKKDWPICCETIETFLNNSNKQ